VAADHPVKIGAAGECCRFQLHTEPQHRGALI
jgi:hypothetical protein